KVVLTKIFQDMLVPRAVVIGTGDFTLQATGYEGILHIAVAHLAFVFMRGWLSPQQRLAHFTDTPDIIVQRIAVSPDHAFARYGRFFIFRKVLFDTMLLRVLAQYQTTKLVVPE